MNNKVFVVTHKIPSYQAKDPVYKMIMVGANNKVFPTSYFRDDIGENISYKNPNYCELTAYYWLWKNYECDNIGICHYRRFFCSTLGKTIKKITGNNTFILSEKRIVRILRRYDCILAKSPFKEEKVSAQFIRCHGILQYNLMEKAVENIRPDYFDTFKKVMDSNDLPFACMIITRKKIFDEYCSWLFPILDYVEDNIDMNEFNAYQKRIYGFIAERLLPVWVFHNGLKVKRLPVINTDESSSLFSSCQKP